MSVQVLGLSKRFGRRSDIIGVEDVSFSAPAHGITALLGPSGSGKSTLLRLVAGLETPDKGSLVVQGKDVTRTAVRNRGIGFVFQSYALFRHMNVFDNVAFSLSLQKRPKAEVAERVTALLELVQLSGYERRLPDQLSGGQRQRIALARALAANPSVLLLDEPFGALDAKVRIELREWLQRLHERTRVTTLLVTHDQEEALELSEHVVLLRDGRVEQAGSPQELYERPKNAFVASFLGGAKVLRGVVSGGRARFGGQAISAPVDSDDGARVEAFVRPHDVRLRKAGTGALPASVAHVERLVWAGGSVKLHLVLPDGTGLTIQMPSYELAEHGIERGDGVTLDLRELRLAPLEYAR